MVTQADSATVHVAVVILSWNRREDTLSCLRSLGEVEWSPLTVVVVDNGSSDGSADAIASAFPDTVLMRSDRNLGFAGGANVGIRLALEHGADAVLLLNNDMVVEPRFVEPLVEALVSDPLAGAACSQILFADPPDRVWYAGARVRIESGHHGRNVGYGGTRITETAAPYKTDCACGGAMLIPRSALDLVGFLDERLFAYREDLDWSLRARACGQHVLVVPASVVRHKVSASTGGEASPTSLYYDVRNGLVVAERYDPRSRVRTELRRLESVLAHLAQAALSRRRGDAFRAVLDGWRDARRRTLGQRRN